MPTKKSTTKKTEDTPEEKAPVAQCFNCDKDATWESDGETASVVKLCDDHKPR